MSEGGSFFLMAGKFNHRFWHTRRGLALLQSAALKAFRDIREDIVREVVNPITSRIASKHATPSVPPPTTKRPRIYASYAMSEKWTGSHRYCGGEKSLNNLVLLLRRHGYEAWMVTLDGKQAGWLCEQAPCISLAEFQRHLAENHPTRCITSWLEAHLFLDACGPFYYWDHELATAAEYQFPTLWSYLRSGRIKKLAGFNRSIRAWMQAHFATPTDLVRSLIDENLWKPDPARRVPHRVGYIEESPDTPALVESIRQSAEVRGLDLDFLKMSGDEPEMIAQMQTCRIFLVTNPGKSGLWGEGGPLGPHESAACGAIPICFDLDGPRESIQSGYNGVIVPRNRPDLMAKAVCDLFENPDSLEAMSVRAREIILSSHALETRWPEVADFLDLPLS